MTADELRASTAVYVVPADVAGILGSNAQSIREMARRAPQGLGFPVCVIGQRVRIPRVPFLRFMGLED